MVLYRVVPHGQDRRPVRLRDVGVVDRVGAPRVLEGHGLPHPAHHAHVAQGDAVGQFELAGMVGTGVGVGAGAGAGASSAKSGRQRLTARSTRRESFALMPRQSDAKQPIVNTNGRPRLAAPARPPKAPSGGCLTQPAPAAGGAAAERLRPPNRRAGPPRKSPRRAPLGKYFVDTPSRLRDLVGFPHRLSPHIFTIMAHSEILLVKPVEGLGGEGDQVKVRAGYARNFLLPRGWRSRSPRRTASRSRRSRSAAREREAQELSGAQELAQKLEKTSLAFAVTTGEGGKMFGAITAARPPRQARRRRRSRSTASGSTCTPRSRRSASTRSR